MHEFCDVIADKQAVAILLYETLFNLHPSKLPVPGAAVFHMSHKSISEPLSSDPNSHGTSCGKRRYTTQSPPRTQLMSTFSLTTLFQYFKIVLSHLDFYNILFCFTALSNSALPWQSCYNLYIVCILIPIALGDPSGRRLPQYKVPSSVL